MSMLTERLQVLISPEQRRRLEAEAGRRETSVATVVREAIEAALGAPTLADRRQALDSITGMGGGYLSPDELEAVVDEERERAAPQVGDG